MDASHYTLHQRAAALAESATLFFLENLRQSFGNQRYFDFLNIKPGRSLAIAMDTTASMGPFIAAARVRCEEIVNNSRNGPNAPRNYVLVPFNDPKFGPAFR